MSENIALKQFIKNLVEIKAIQEKLLQYLKG